MNPYYSFLLIFGLTSCSLNHDEIKNSTWKYYEGNIEEDVFQIEEIRNDTVFQNSKPKAKILDAYKRYDGREFLEVETFNNKKGKYISI